MRNGRWILKGGAFVVLAIAFVGVLSFVVMSLWNGLVPSLFGGPGVHYWQAVGLLVLSRILFGGFRGRGGHGHYWRRMWWERFHEMSPAERARFREGLERWDQMTREERIRWRKGIFQGRHGCGREDDEVAAQPKP